MAFEMNQLPGEGLTFHLKGDLDINSSPLFKTQLLEAYQRKQDNIVLDFTDLDYLDSTGLGALISVYKNTKLAGHRITIRHPKKNVEKLFYITELDQEFDLEA